MSASINATTKERMMDQSQPDTARTRIDSMLTSQPDRDAVCPNHGPFVSKNLFGRVWGKCPACQQERAEQRAESERRGEEAREADRLLIRKAQSGLVGRFKDATFDSYTATNEAQEQVKTACRNFAESLQRKNGGLWLVGPPGTGKTHLGSAMVNYVMREGRGRASIRSAREIVRMLRATWGTRDARKGWDDMPATEDGLIDHFGSLDLLVLDEVGVSYGADSEMVQLFDVLDLRYRNELPTVLLSNLPVGELKAALGDRAYDRLREGAVLLPCKWGSHRASGSNA